MNPIVHHRIPRLAAVLALATRTLCAAQAPPAITPAERAHLRIPGMFDLDAAKRYEGLHRWKEAEQEYLTAARNGAVCVKKEATEGIRRVEPHRPADDAEGFEFDLAKYYESEKDWKSAGQHYGAAGKDAPPTVRAKAMEGVKKANEHQWFVHFVENLDRGLGYLARAMGLCIIPFILYKVWRVWHAIQCDPFHAPTDEAAQRIGFSLLDAREELPALLSPPLATLAGHVVDSLPLMILPGLDGDLDEPIEDLELGEIKLPLANLIKVIKRPKVRITGRWNVGNSAGTAHARIVSRRWFVAFRESHFSRFPIPSASGDPQNLQLTLFSYDVLVKAVFSFYGL